MTERREESRRHKILKDVVQGPIEQSSPRNLVKEHLAAVVIRRWLCRQNRDRLGFGYTDRGRQGRYTRFLALSNRLVEVSCEEGSRGNGISSVMSMVRV